jgi:hypothetical protein
MRIVADYKLASRWKLVNILFGFPAKSSCPHSASIGYDRGKADFVLSGVTLLVDEIFVSDAHVLPHDSGVQNCAFSFAPLKTSEHLFFISVISEGLPHCPNGEKCQWPKADEEHIWTRRLHGERSLGETSVAAILDDTGCVCKVTIVSSLCARWPRKLEFCVPSVSSVVNQEFGWAVGQPQKPLVPCLDFTVKPAGGVSW